ncbi:MAG: glycoside hydrolase family 25 protein [Agathobacter sp.]|uniref:glycoside hydrolase family 25 protein n=1 Tax=Agathobacter sp. TaxID=2021311 RepID=UPI00258CE3C2|nr:glycoside hydrolase family 25 protein [Agathobacter sp.]MCR5677351.1 glycoside hydrolase family 25 protein [Agathobacter sp.]
MKKSRLWKWNVIILMTAVGLCSCGLQPKKVIKEIKTETEIETDTQIPTQLETEGELKTEFKFRDVKGKEYRVDIHNEWAPNPFDVDKFVKDKNGKMAYSSEEYSYRLGVDVSKYSKDIDWNAVKEDGYEFAIIRVGFRGYGRTGQLVEDPYAIKNIKGALNAGLEIGVYFFSQAINEVEAVEEAQFTMQILEKADVDLNDLKLPVVFDPETITDDEARTDDVSGEQFTANALAFFKEIEANGYHGMIYSNMLWEAYQLDLVQLKDYPVWYADYEEKPQTPYAFQMWQYSESAVVSGIPNACDVNIELIPK